MHGKNEVRKQVLDDGMKLQVRSVFFTIQGEGPFAGERAVFIRLTGCHLRCTFCDTQWDDENDKYLDIKSLADAACFEWDTGARRPNSFDFTKPLFVITGGEPCRQNITPLVRRLRDRRPGSRVQIETAGNFWSDCMEDENVITVVSPKTPKIDPKVRLYASAFKYVIRHDDLFTSFGTPIGATQPGTTGLRPLSQPPQHMPANRVFLSPCDEGSNAVETNRLNRKKVAELAMRYGYRAAVQLHKLLEVE